MTLNEDACSLINLQNSITGREIDYLLANKGTSRKDKCAFTKTLFPYVTRENTTLTEHILIAY